MTRDQFLANLNKALEANTCYLQGGFGQRLWTSDWYNKDYSWNKKNASIIEAHSAKKDHCFGFDCVCLIKACLWGFSASFVKKYGGSVYASNGVPDCTITSLKNSCGDTFSTDWVKDPEIGEILFYDQGGSHVGVYIGNGQVIEATPAWACGVQKTLLPDRLNPEKLPVRKWYGHGKTSYIDYPEPLNTWEAAYNLLSTRYGDLESELKKANTSIADLQKRNAELAAALSAAQNTIRQVKELVK